MTLPLEIQNMMLEMQIAGIERRRAAIVADPVKHKLALDFPEGARMNSRYWGKIKVSKNRTVSYHYSTERNLAGYFLGWRETWDTKKGEGKRDQWIASKRRTTVHDKAKQRTDAHKKRLARDK